MTEAEAAGGLSGDSAEKLRDESNQSCMFSGECLLTHLGLVLLTAAAAPSEQPCVTPDATVFPSFKAQSN